jgi:hypothetical protein
LQDNIDSLKNITFTDDELWRIGELGWKNICLLSAWGCVKMKFAEFITYELIVDTFYK